MQTEADLSDPTPTLFENAQKRIQALMEKDSYSRFLRSDIYLTILNEARETTKAAANAALIASLQDAGSDDYDQTLVQLVGSHSSSPFGFLSTLGHNFSGINVPTLNLPAVAAAAATADAGMNDIKDLQLLGLSTSRYMRDSKQIFSNIQNLSKQNEKNNDDV